MYAYVRYLALLAIVAVSACNCEEEPLVPTLPGSCEPTYACPTGFEYRRGDCREARCSVDEECCPGQTCNARVGLCANQGVECMRNADCAEVPGQECIDFRGGQFCGYPNKLNTLSEAGTQACTGNADCADGRSCVGQRCLTTAPCGGGCDEGSVCDLDTNTCFPGVCETPCAEGQVAVLSDPDSMSGPMCCTVTCDCATLPPIKSGEFGWYASLALTADEVLVSAYDPDYGDLVVARFDDEGKPLGVQYVDGFPTSGPLVGDPAGIRGGRDELGPNVGQHTSIVVDLSNVVHIAYYDVDRGALSYASYSGGVWSKTTVDDDGDTGRYTSIAIGPDGNPRIAYMMAEGVIAPDPAKQAALKIAVARTNMPTSPGDWSVETIDSSAIPVPICGGGSTGGNRASTCCVNRSR